MWSACAVTLLAALLVVLPNSAYAQDGVSCVNPRGERGVCRNIKTCEPLLNLLRENKNETFGFLRQSVCDYEDKRNPRVCCPFNENINGNNDGAARGSKYGPLLAPVCGKIDAKYTRVVGGVPAKLGTWPWMAVLGYRGLKNPNKPRWKCGGSLISARHVLTAAHCVYRLNDLYIVRLGELDLESDNDGATPIDVGIQQRTYHSNYNPATHVNDIAVLKLAQDIQFTPLIKPLCLPVTDTIKNKNLVDSFPFLAGWGDIYYNGPSSSALQQLQVRVVALNDCKAAFRNFSNLIIDDRLLCAGWSQGGKDSCKGDSGGPLMYPVKGIFYVIGIVSYGFKCAEAGFPGVYTRATKFLDFVIPLLN